MGLDSGRPVFPLQPNKKIPFAKTRGFHDATAGESKIAEWKRQYPHCNWGMPTGEATGIVVIDIDAKNGNDGFPAWYDLLDRNEHAETLEILTPSGGMHIYFQQPAGVKLQSSASKLAQGIDTRATGGYVVVPPSTIDGVRYEFVNPDVPIAPVPDWLLAIWPRAGELSDKGRAERTGGSLTVKCTVPTDRTMDGAVLTQGQRNDGLTRVAGRFWHTGVTLGQLTVDLLTYNLKWCSPPLPDWEVISIADSVSRYAQITRAERGAGGLLDDTLSYEEMDACLGSDLPKETIFKAGQSQKSSTTVRVPRLVRALTVVPTFEEKQAVKELWKKCLARFPDDPDVEPYMLNFVVSDRAKRGFTAHVYQNTWRNESNAQNNRRKMLYNLFPRLVKLQEEDGAVLYHRSFSADIWTQKLRDSLKGKFDRRGGVYVAFDNTYEDDAIPCLATVPLDANWVEVDPDPEALFDLVANWLERIWPRVEIGADGKPKRPRYVWGHDALALGLMASPDPDQDKADLIGVLPVTGKTAPSDANIAAYIVAHGGVADYGSAIWKAQRGASLQMDRVSPLLLAQMVVHFGGTLTEHGRALLELLAAEEAA